MSLAMDVSDVSDCLAIEVVSTTLKASFDDLGGGGFYSLLTSHTPNDILSLEADVLLASCCGNWYPDPCKRVFALEVPFP